MIFAYRDALDAATNEETGEGVDLPTSPVLTPDQIRSARRMHMRRMRDAGYSVAIVAAYFNLSTRQVIRETVTPGYRGKAYAC